MSEDQNSAPSCNVSLREKAVMLCEIDPLADSAARYGALIPPAVKECMLIVRKVCHLLQVPSCYDAPSQRAHTEL